MSKAPFRVPPPEFFHAEEIDVRAVLLRSRFFWAAVVTLILVIGALAWNGQ